jgi:hypothetical protein
MSARWRTDAAIRKPSASARTSKPDVASQIRVAFSNMALNMGSNSPADPLMTLRTSEVAENCSNASSRSWRRRVNSLSGPTVEELRRRNVGAVPSLGISALRRRALACLPLALERRGMACPKALNYTPAGFRWHDYSRDL